MEKQIYTKKIASVAESEMRYGRGMVTKLVNESIGANNIDVHINRIYAGSAEGPMHYHEHTENVYIVFSGQLCVKTPDKEYNLTKDDFLFIPPGIPHSTSNVGSEDAILLEIYAPCGKDFIELTKQGD